MREGRYRILSAAIDNWLSRGYLAGCTGLLIWVVFDAVFSNSPDPSFAAVWPIFATLPASFLAVLLVGGSGFLLPSAVTLPLFVLLLSAAAVFNATMLGLMLRRVRQRRSQP